MSWPAVTDGPIDPARSVDPHATWAAATRGAYLASHTADRCRLALQLRDGFTIAALRAVPGLTVPGIYPDGARFCSAEMATWDATGWQQLHDLAQVLLAEPGLARPDDEPRPLDRMRRRRPARPLRKGSGVVVGVVDGPCGFANRQFRRRAEDGGWQTRLVALWDQQGNADESTAAWRRPPELGYGRELKIETFNDLLVTHLDREPDDDDASQAFGERALYRALGVALPAAADWSHGTHVLDTAGGWPPRAATPTATGSTPRNDEPLAPTADVAGAELVVVQLPEVALRDTSGRWLPALVLDALRYIVACAGDAQDIVVNLSLAAFAGPHDGTSMLERAIDDLIAEVGERLTVVVAAGNAALPRNDGDGTPRRCDAEARLDAGGEASLPVDIEFADATETFIEIWLPGSKDIGSDKPATAVSVALVPPEGDAITAAPGEVATWRHEPSGMALAQIVNLSGRGGDGPRGALPMVLVAIGTTRDVAGWRAPLGRWKIAVQRKDQGARPVLMQAWVERRDVPGELPGERPQYGFADEETSRPGSAADKPARRPSNTLGSLANGERTIVVAGADFPVANDPRNAPPPPVISPVSSLGPAPRQDDAAVRKSRGSGPVVAAPCEFAAAGFLTDSRKSLKGTSMSAAWVTRLVAARILAYGPPNGGVRDWLSRQAVTGTGAADAAAAATGSGPARTPAPAKDQGPAGDRPRVPIIRDGR